MMPKQKQQLLSQNIQHFIFPRVSPQLVNGDVRKAAKTSLTSFPIGMRCKHAAVTSCTEALPLGVSSTGIMAGPFKGKARNAMGTCTTCGFGASESERSRLKFRGNKAHSSPNF